MGLTPQGGHDCAHPRVECAAPFFASLSQGGVILGLRPEDLPPQKMAGSSPTMTANAPPETPQYATIVSSSYSATGSPS